MAYKKNAKGIIINNEEVDYKENRNDKEVDV